jgi:hypothetical protein
MLYNTFNKKNVFPLLPICRQYFVIILEGGDRKDLKLILGLSQRIPLTILSNF